MIDRKETDVKRKRHSEEKIIGILREAEAGIQHLLPELVLHAAPAGLISRSSEDLIAVASATAGGDAS